MSAVAKFLQGKVDESLTKLVQPAGLVPAAVFVVLNLAFVLPELSAAGVSFATGFADLDESWQIVIAGFAVVFLGYLLISVSGNILDLLSGESWRGTPLYAALVKRTKRVVGRARPEPGALGEPGSLEAIGAAWDLRAAYPISDVTMNKPPSPEQLSDLGPTKLGNAVRATHRLIFERYGLDLVALWPQTEASIDKDSVAATAATDAKASLDTLVNLTFVLAAFGVEGLLLFSALGDWSGALLSALVFPVAYVAYRAAVVKARAWGDTIETIVDFSREDLRKKLDLRETTSARDERDLWTKASRVFLWGRGNDETADEIFDGQPAADATTATITASRNLEVARHAEEPADVPGTMAAGRRVARVVDYELVASRAGEHGITDGVIALRDKRVLRIARVPEVTVSPADGPPPVCAIAESGSAPDSLIIRLPRLHRGAALWLGFSLPIWEALVPEDFTVIGAPAKLGTTLDFVVHGPQGSGFTLDVFAGLWSSTPALLLKPSDGTRITPTPHQGRHRFTLQGTALDKTLRVVFDEEPPDEK